MPEYRYGFGTDHKEGILTGTEGLDQIFIEDLDVYAHHGVFQKETKEGQHFLIRAVLYTDTRDAGETDDLTKATNYGEVCQTIHRFLKTHTYRLLERAAEELAREILYTYPRIRSLTLEIRKPQAPIDLPFGCVSVKITRGWKRTLIALGSNLGDKRGYLQKALKEMETDPGIRILRVSDLMETKPYGGVEQDDFVNGAVVAETLYTPWRLLEKLHEIEQHASRKREVRWGPRTLDLDILLYEDLIMDSEGLTIPHKDMQNREFVLTPATQIAGGWIHPVLGKSMGQLLEEVLQK